MFYQPKENKNSFTYRGKIYERRKYSDLDSFWNHETRNWIGRTLILTSTEVITLEFNLNDEIFGEQIYFKK